MHVRELVELGALVAVHGGNAIQHASPLTQRSMEQYWLASRCRHDRWFQATKTYEQTHLMEKIELWPRMRAIMEEVLASELLTRVWTTVGCLSDLQHKTSYYDSLLRSVLVGHTEARNRVLHILLRGKGFAIEEGAELNRLRRQTERWTDVMLGHIVCGAGSAGKTERLDEEAILEFAFDVQLARDFAADLTDKKRTPVEQTALELMLTSLHATFHKHLSVSSVHGELNQRIAASVMACMHRDLFEPSDTPQSHWTLRLGQVTAEAERLVNDLLLLDAVAESCSAATVADSNDKMDR